jgi:hypothetical protein
MSETPEDRFESQLRDALAREAHRHHSSPDIVANFIGRAQRHGRRMRRRAAAVVAAVVVVSVAAFVVPAQLRTASTVRLALSGVFSPPAVQLTITDPVSPYSVQVTLTNPTGGSVSSAAASDNLEISVQRAGTTLLQVVVDGGAVYVRVHLVGFYRAPEEAISSWQSAAQQDPQLWYLSTLAGGAWVGTTVSSVDTYLASGGHPAPSPSDVGDLRSAFALSFAQSWDAWSSASKLSTSDGVTEYAVTLPTRNFLGTLLSDATAELTKAIPESAQGVTQAVQWIDEIPAGDSVPVRLWLANGSLTKMQIPLSHGAYDIAVSDTARAVSAPAGALMIDGQSAAAAFGSGASLVFGCNLLTVTGPIDSPASLVVRALLGSMLRQCTVIFPSNGTAAQANLQDALTAAKTYFTDSGQTFLGLTNSASSTTSSIQEIGSGLSYASDAASDGPHTISTDVGGNGSYVILTAYAPGTRWCWGILEITAAQEAAVLGVARQPGTYFFVASPSASCDAASLSSVSASSTAGFPAGPSDG